MKMIIRDLRRILRLGIWERRTWKFVFQYLWNGYSDMDTWSVDWYVANKLQPVLHRFTDVCYGPRTKRMARLAAAENDRYVETNASCIYTETFQRRVCDKLTWFWW